MRQPITFSMQQRVRRSILARIALITCLLGGYVVFTIMLQQSLGVFLDRFFSDPLLVGGWIVLAVVAVAGYVILLAAYFKARALPSIVINEAGIHANKLFIAWNNIAAIYPCRIGARQTEAVGVLPRDLELVFRQSRLNAFTRGTLRVTALLARLWGLPPFALRPDTMPIQELLWRLWHAYYPEFHRYNISTYPPRR